MPKTLKFSQFIQETSPVTGDVTVGLHAGVNTQFTSPGSGGSGALSHQVMQTAHGFTVGQIIGLSGANYVLTLSDSAVDAETTGMVTMVIDADNFIVSMAGYITGLGSTAYSPMTAGDVYFLSNATPGLLSLTQPSTPGQVSLPLFKADSPNSGWLFPYRGMVNTSGSSGGGGGGGSYPGVDEVTINDTSGSGSQLGVNLIDPVFNAPLLVGNAASGPFQSASTGIETVGNVFTSTGASTVPTWQAAPGAGNGFVWLGSVTASNTPSIQFNNLLTSSYDNYVVIFEGVVPIDNINNIYCQFGYGGGPTYISSSYNIQGTGNSSHGNGGFSYTGKIGYQLNNRVGVTAGGLTNNVLYGAGGRIEIYNVNSSSSYQTATCMLSSFDGQFSNANVYTGSSGSCTASTQVLTSLQFILDSGNFALGTFKLYGYRN